MSRVHLLLALLLLACQSRPRQEPVQKNAQVASGASAGETGAAIFGEESAHVAPSPLTAPTTNTKKSPPMQAPALRCPSGMNWVKGGSFEMGSPVGRGAADEHPRFTTQVAGFCMASTETTVQAYAACVQAGTCTPARSGTRTCNADKKDRRDHPINCVTFNQAHAFCQAQGRRLPSEAEWEYAARGGEQLLPFPWGEGSPDGKACWKRAHSCPVTQHAAGAFGLRDMVGNVWEWVDDRYGSYPWPSARSPLRVYRGGSWSRRFDKWMRPTLRNRYREGASGSHLGFRCAFSPEPRQCPYGNAQHGGCLRGVESIECPRGTEWNGARCARPGAARCRPQFHVEPGLGCVLDTDAQLGRSGASDDPTAGVRLAPSPSHDADCRTFQAARPRAFRLTGGTHVGRNRVAQSKGCKNRDVGVGWNSACCP